MTHRSAASLALAALLASLAPATAAAKGLALKPAFGVGFSDVSKDPATGTSQGKASWQVGGTLMTGERLYLEAGAFYARKSTDITAVEGNQSIDFQGLSGLRIPATVGYHLIGREQSPIALRIFGGGSAFIVTSVDATGVSKSDFESPTWGLFAGAGVDFLFLFADLEYEWSVTDASKLSTVDVGQSRSLFLNVGVKLPL